MAIYLSLKELWRGRGRFLLISLVIALITLLVLFVAGLAEGLGSGNIEYLSKINADLIVYQENSQLSIGASRLDRSKLGDIARLDGVEAVGPLAFSSATIVLPNGQKPLDVSLIGLEPGKPGGEASNERVQDGDIINVARQAMFYIYGEVQRPGAFRLEQNMTVVQALSMGGGITPRGTQRGITILRRGADGTLQELEAELADPVKKDDVIYVKESLF